MLLCPQPWLGSNDMVGFGMQVLMQWDFAQVVGSENGHQMLIEFTQLLLIGLI